MGLRIELVLLFLLATCFASHARKLVTIAPSQQETGISNSSVLQLNHQYSKRVFQSSVAIGRNEEVCKFCEEFTTQALEYLAQNKTQDEIMNILRESCSKLFSFKHKCINLVDFYAPLFFLRISLIQPEKFCGEVNLCEKIVSISQHLSQDSCGFCHDAVAKILVKLKDPDTQMEIIEIFLKGCNTVEKYVKQCKRLVFEYGPVILVDAEKFLEANDICAMFHACGSKQKSMMTEKPMISTS